MRCRKDVKNSNRHNQTKLLILKELAYPHRWLTSEDIAEACNLTYVNASRQMTKLVGQGYVYRKDTGGRYYRYRHLKHMGERVLKKLWMRQWVIDKTGDVRVDLNLEHTLPDDLQILLVEAEQEFNSWMYAR